MDMRNTGLDAEQRRALELLAAAVRGHTEAFMRAQGFTLQLLIDLIREELATAQPETIRAGDQTIEGTRVTITDAGRRALKGHSNQMAPCRR